jgi:hypothetical protein
MGHTTQPSVAESIYNARETKYLRKHIYYDYTSLIKRAKANDYSPDRLIEESAEIRSKSVYKKNHAAILPYAYEMPFHILSKYADAVTRVTKNNMAFLAPIMVQFSHNARQSCIHQSQIQTRPNCGMGPPNDCPPARNHPPPLLARVIILKTALHNPNS